MNTKRKPFLLGSTIEIQSYSESPIEGITVAQKSSNCFRLRFVRFVNRINTSLSSKFTLSVHSITSTIQNDDEDVK